MTTTNPTTSPTQPLLDLLAPFATKVAALNPEGCTDDAAATALAKALQAEFPFEGDAVQAVGAEIRRGVADGWLCDRGQPDARFSRVAKPGRATAEMSVDVVALRGAAVRHTHPRGEVTIAFPAQSGPAGAFDGHPPGWVVMAAGSTHTPTVTGPTMHLLYFLPGGAVQWHTD